MLVPMLITIKEGLVYSAKIAKNRTHLEDLFLIENECYGREPNDQDFDNGFVELEGITICMVWAEKDN